MELLRVPTLRPFASSASSNSACCNFEMGWRDGGMCARRRSTAQVERQAGEGGGVVACSAPLGAFRHFQALLGAFRRRLKALKSA
eukprot:8097466-Alexandrium_andersonii.AAC.1